ncbi:MAG TPA: hypothetical protein VJJ83_02060 [Candidatus Babeliales bacterium]|nr:hypothetical protein [Candidatus Babeliales bacterium]
MSGWSQKLSVVVLVSSLIGSVPVISDQSWGQEASPFLQQVQVGLQAGGGTILLVGGSLTALLAIGMWAGACYTTAADLLCPEPWTQVKAISTSVFGLLIAWWGWQILQSARATA